MREQVTNKRYFGKILLLIISNLLFLGCNHLDEIEESKKGFIEIFVEKAFVSYSEDIAFGWSPRRIYVETTIISHLKDTTLFLVSDKRFHEPFIKSRIVAIVNKDTVFLSPNFSSHNFEVIGIAPKDTIEQIFSYVIDAYLHKYLEEKDKGQLALKKGSRKFDKQIITDLLDAPLVFIPNEKEYKNETYYWANASKMFVPKAIFTKAKTFKIFIEDYKTLRCENCD